MTLSDFSKLVFLTKKLFQKSDETKKDFSKQAKEHKRNLGRDKKLKQCLILGSPEIGNWKTFYFILMNVNIWMKLYPNWAYI